MFAIYVPIVPHPVIYVPLSNVANFQGLISLWYYNAYTSSVTESLKSLSLVQETKKAQSRKRNPNLRYYMSSTHSTLEEAEAFVKTERRWRCK